MSSMSTIREAKIRLGILLSLQQLRHSLAVYDPMLINFLFMLAFVLIGDLRKDDMELKN